MIDKAYYICRREHSRFWVGNDRHEPFGELQIGDLLNADDMYNLIQSGRVDGVNDDKIKSYVMDNFSIDKDEYGFEVYFNYLQARNAISPHKYAPIEDVTIYEVACDRDTYHHTVTIASGKLPKDRYFYKRIQIRNIAYRFNPLYRTDSYIGCPDFESPEVSKQKEENDNDN